MGTEAVGSGRPNARMERRVLGQWGARSAARGGNAQLLGLGIPHNRENRHTNQAMP